MVLEFHDFFLVQKICFFNLFLRKIRKNGEIAKMSNFGFRCIEIQKSRQYFVLGLIIFKKKIRIFCNVFIIRKSYNSIFSIFEKKSRKMFKMTMNNFHPQKLRFFSNPKIILQLFCKSFAKNLARSQKTMSLP